MYPADEKVEAEEKGGEAAAGSSPNTATADSTKEKLGDQIGDGGGGGIDETTTSVAAPEPAPPAPELSVEEMVRQEAEALRSGSDKTHRFKSVNTTVKGVVMVCVMDPKIDILRLVDALYAEIRTTKMRRSRFLERVTPLQVTSYSDLESFKQAAEPMISAALPPVAEGVPPLPVVVRAGASTAAKPGGAKPGTEKASSDGVGKVETAEVVDEKQGVSSAAGSKPGAPGNGTPIGAKKEVVGVDGGKEKRTSDKRWKYRVDLRRRNSGLKRMDLINVAAGSVGEGHSVNMASPEVIVQ
ncbi:unnamed protein product [Hapterophycus canaliculatus]